VSARNPADLAHRAATEDAHAIGAVTGLQGALDRRIPPSTFVIFGDSITALNTNPLNDCPDVVGYFTHARMALGSVRLLNNAGIGGNTTAMMLARIDAAVIAYAPGWCIVQGGGNDVGQGVTAETITSNLTAIYTALSAAAIRIVACTITPTTSADTADKRAALYAVNTWIRDYAMKNPNVVLCDWFNAIADPDTGGPATGMTSDGAHPSMLGAARMGKVLYDALAPYVPFTIDLLPMSNAETDNIVSNGMLTGDNNGFATSWTTWDQSGIWSLAGSKVARSYPARGEWQQIVVSVPGSAPTNDWSFYQSVAIGEAVAIGDVIYAVCEYEIDEGWTLGRANGLPLYLYARAHNVIQRATPFKSSTPAEDATYWPLKGVLVTVPLVIPVETTSVRLIVSGSLVGTVRIGRCALRKV